MPIALKRKVSWQLGAKFRRNYSSEGKGILGEMLQICSGGVQLLQEMFP